MELKAYDKAWSTAFKGAFLIVFGLIAMLRIVGSIRTLAVLFIVLIGMVSLLMIGTGIFFRKTKFRLWTIILGAINWLFCLYLGLHIAAPRNEILWIILIWVLFYAITEVVEGVLLFREKNAFGALFMQNALLTFLFGYFLYMLLGNFTAQGIFYIGIIALIIGIANEFCAYLLSQAYPKN